MKMRWNNQAQTLISREAHNATPMLVVVHLSRLIPQTQILSEAAQQQCYCHMRSSFGTVECSPNATEA